VKKKNRRTFAIRRRFLRVLGNAAIIALSLVGVNSVHSEKKPPDGHSSGGKAELYTKVLSLVGRQRAAFACPLAWVLIWIRLSVLKAPSVYLCWMALLVCPF
jgi:hypothetical protein